MVTGGFSDDSEHADDFNAGPGQHPSGEVAKSVKSQLEKLVCLANKNMNVVDHLFCDLAVSLRAQVGTDAER